MAVLKPFDLGRVLKTASALRSADQQQELNQYKLDEAQRGNQFRDALRGAMSDPKQMTELSKSFPLLMQQYNRGIQKDKTADLNFQVNGYKLMQYGAKTVIDEKSYQRFKQQMERTGVSDPGELPDKYDDNTKKMLSGLSTQASQALKKLSFRSGDQQQDFIVSGGNVVHKGKPYNPTSSKGTFKGGYSVLLPDGREMAGKIDPQGNTLFQDDDKQWKVAPPGHKTYKTKVQADRANALAGSIGYGKKSQGEIEKNFMEADEVLQRLKVIESDYKPNFSLYSTKMGMWWRNLKEKAGADLSSKEKSELTKYSQWAQNAADHINRYINLITGAAMTNAEAPRIRKGTPDYQKDGPTQFMAKMKRQMQVMENIKRRMYYMRKSGMTLDKIAYKMPLTGNGTKAFMNKKAMEYYNTLSGSEKEKRLKVNQYLKDNFGIGK